MRFCILSQDDKNRRDLERDLAISSCENCPDYALKTGTFCGIILYIRLEV